jgi:hypothetical protein
LEKKKKLFARLEGDPYGGLGASVEGAPVRLRAVGGTHFQHFELGL